MPLHDVLVVALVVTASGTGIMTGKYLGWLFKHGKDYRAYKREHKPVS